MCTLFQDSVHVDGVKVPIGHERFHIVFSASIQFPLLDFVRRAKLGDTDPGGKKASAKERIKDEIPAAPKSSCVQDPPRTTCRDVGRCNSVEFCNCP